MTPSRLGLCALVFGALLAPRASGQMIPSSAGAPSYRGFAPGASYRDFADRARRLARRDALVCNTSRRTAQLMECGVLIRDPADSATLYLSAYVLEGRVAMLSFGDSGTVRVVDRMKRDLAARYGRPRQTGIGTWEWTFGRQVVRLNWRGRGTARWVYVVLEDRDVLDRISQYARVRRRQ